MTVHPYEGPEGLVRGHVDSESGPDQHFVDLSANAGTGFCDCPRFRCVLGPQLAGKKSVHPDLRCKHIQAFRQFTGQQLLDTYIRNINQNP